MNISGIRCTVRYQRPASQSRLGLLITFENPNRAICGAASRGAAVLDTSKLEAWYLGLVFTCNIACASTYHRRLQILVATDNGLHYPTSWRFPVEAWFLVPFLCKLLQLQLYNSGQHVRPTCTLDMRGRF